MFYEQGSTNASPPSDVSKNSKSEKSVTTSRSFQTSCTSITNQNMRLLVCWLNGMLLRPLDLSEIHDGTWNTGKPTFLKWASDLALKTSLFSNYIADCIHLTIMKHGSTAIYFLYLRKYRHYRPIREKE